MTIFAEAKPPKLIDKGSCTNSTNREVLGFK